MVLVWKCYKFNFEALRAPSERAENKNGYNEVGSGAFRLTPARWRSSGAPKTLAFSRAAEFG